jgi:hypothetical protein
MTSEARPFLPWCPALFLAFGLLTVAGCKHVEYGVAGRKPPVASTTFQIVFTGSCVTAVNPTENNCDAEPGAGQPRDCAKLKPGGSVTFEASPPGRKFTLFFNPFRHGGIEAEGSLTKSIDPTLMGRKPYTFTVREFPDVPGCKDYDPQIIVEK